MAEHKIGHDEFSRIRRWRSNRKAAINRLGQLELAYQQERDCILFDIRDSMNREREEAYKIARAYGLDPNDVDFIITDDGILRTED